MHAWPCNHVCLQASLGSGVIIRTWIKCGVYTRDRGNGSMEGTWMHFPNKSIKVYGRYWRAADDGARAVTRVTLPDLDLRHQNHVMPDMGPGASNICGPCGHSLHLTRLCTITHAFQAASAL